MTKINKIITIVFIFMLTKMFLQTDILYALRPPLQMSFTQREVIKRLNTYYMIEDNKQKLIAMDVSEIPREADIGEKAYKLLKMARVGLNIPSFFIIIGDGSGKITITNELRTFLVN